MASFKSERSLISGGLNSGFDDSKAAAEAFVQNMNVTFDTLGGKAERTFDAIWRDRCPTRCARWRSGQPRKASG